MRSAVHMVLAPVIISLALLFLYTTATSYPHWVGDLDYSGGGRFERNLGGEATGVDVSVPSLVITSPVNGETLSGIIPFLSTESDAEGVNYTEIRLDGASVYLNPFSGTRAPQTYNELELRLARTTAGTARRGHP